MGTGGGERGTSGPAWPDCILGEKMTSGKDAWYMVSSACREPMRAHSPGNFYRSYN